MTTTVARKYIIEIHNPADDDKLVCILDNAHTIAYTEAINQAPRLSFDLPADDDKAVNITKANEIWLRNYEAGTVVLKFRLSLQRDVRQGTLITTINAEGLIGQLADELVITYLGEDLTITQIVTALLDFQILTPAITVGTINPVVTRSISVTGDTILRALYRLRDTVGGHIYVDSNRALQWKTTIGEDKGQQIRYQKNLKGITREIDYTTLANRLYAYGAGEGDARIKLSDAEGQDEDYVEDAGAGSSQERWGGIYRKNIVDKSITHPDTLLAWAQLKLADLKEPRITYRVDTVDLSESIEVDFSFEVLKIGSTIKVIDEDLGIGVSAQVVKITHPDLLHPELMEIEVANRVKDISDSLAEVYDIQQLALHIATLIGAGQVIVKGVFTVLDWATGGETTIDGANITTGTVVLNKLDFIPLTSAGETGEIIATINATGEGIKISADKVEILAGHRIFKQAAIPTSETVGDLWFDTDDDNRLYRAAAIDADEITPGEWELVRDTGIAQAIADAAAAQSTADSKIVTFYQDAIPTSLEAGDFWIDTNDKNKLYRAACAGADEITAGEWEASRDTDIAQAIADAAGAQSTADSKIVTFFQAGIPTSTDIGDLWVDTDDDNKLYRAACVGANEITAGEWELARDEGIAANAAAIVVNEDNISLNVTNITTLDGRVTTAEGEIVVNAGAITLKVSKDDVINQINISTEEIQIEAAKIELAGTVVFVGGAAADVNAGETTISGGKITTGTIEALQIAADAIITDKIITGAVIPAKTSQGIAWTFTGQYSGDNTDDRRILLGYKCYYIIIHRVSYIWQWESMSTGGARLHYMASPYHSGVTYIKLHATDGFIVGSVGNNSGETYRYVAICGP